MKVFKLFCTAVLGAALAWGESFSDDFNRPNTEFGTEGSPIGSNWNTSAPGHAGAMWRIDSGKVQADDDGPAGGPAILYNTNVSLNSPFTCSVDVLFKGGWAGVVFHYQDADNYYALRIRAHPDTPCQIIRCRNGRLSSLLTQHFPGGLLGGNRVYTVTVSSEPVGSFSFQITRQGEPGVLISGRVSDSTFTNGYAGLYCQGLAGRQPDALFDNVTLNGETSDLTSGKSETLSVDELVSSSLAPGRAFDPVATHAQAAGQLRPNILFIFTDDQRFDAIGYENPQIQTPNLDRLAKNGVIFENCFVNTSICAVSRANVLTGQYPLRHGVTDFYKILDNHQLKQTYPALLRDAGYYTGIVGKWGIGHTVENTYVAVPFFDFWAGASHQTLYWHDQDCPYVTKNGAENICTCGKAINEDGPGPGGHQSSSSHLKNPLHTDTDIFPIKVKQFLAARDPDKPFCLSLFYKAPHMPVSGWDRFKYADTYEGVTFTLAETATKEMADARPGFLKSEKTMHGVDRGYNYLANPESFQQHLRDYNRLVTGMDDSVGKVMDLLEQAGVAENTVVLFTSDNGQFELDHGFLGKWLMYEPSLRVPGFVYDPRLPEALRGRRIDPLITTIDYTATLLDLAGIPVPETMSGRSFLPLLEETPQEKPWPSEFFYDHPYKHHGDIPLIYGVRTERYKYTRYRSQDPAFEQLFDLENDPNETRNLVDDPECAAMLKSLRSKTDLYSESLR